MQITTTPTTVAALRALLADAPDDEAITFAKAPKRQAGPCWCGCGGTTKGRFCPGHDARYHGLAKRVARGEANEAEALAGLAHDEARADFAKHVAAEQPKHEAKQAEIAAAKAAKAAEKAAAKADEAEPELVAVAADEPEVDAEAADFFADLS